MTERRVFLNRIPTDFYTGFYKLFRLDINNSPELLIGASICTSAVGCMRQRRILCESDYMIKNCLTLSLKVTIIYS